MSQSYIFVALFFPPKLSLRLDASISSHGEACDASEPAWTCAQVLKLPDFKSTWCSLPAALQVLFSLSFFKWTGVIIWKPSLSRQDVCYWKAFYLRSKERDKGWLELYFGKCSDSGLGNWLYMSLYWERAGILGVLGHWVDHPFTCQWHDSWFSLICSRLGWTHGFTLWTSSAYSNFFECIIVPLKKMLPFATIVQF